MAEQFIIKALVCINGYSLKKTSNAEYDLLSHPRRAGLETLYATLDEFEVE